MNEPSLLRREFATRIVAGSLAGAALPFASTTASAAEPIDVAAADLVLALIRRQYPADLTDAQWRELRSKIEYHQARSRLLRSMPLTNADELAIVFRVVEHRS